MEGGGTRLKRRPTNKFSENMNEEEKATLTEFLGDNAFVLCCGMVHFEKNDPKAQRQLIQQGTICYVKDYEMKAYYLRLFDLQRRIVLFQQEIYDNFQVRSPDNVARLLTFEGDSCVYSMNFVHEDEARLFKTSLDKLYEWNQKYRRNYTAAPASAGYGGGMGQSRNQSQTNNQAQISSNDVVVPTSNPVAGDLFSSAGYKKSGAASRRPKGNEDSKEKKLTKSDIGMPGDFEHRVHVGWDPGKGLQSNSALNDDMDPSIKQLLEKIGMEKKTRTVVARTPPSPPPHISSLAGTPSVPPPTPPPPPSRPPPPPPSSGGRSDRLCQIHEGRSLKHVEPALDITTASAVGQDKLMDSRLLEDTSREEKSQAECPTGVEKASLSQSQAIGDPQTKDHCPDPSGIRPQRPPRTRDRHKLEAKHLETVVDESEISDVKRGGK